MIIYVFQLFEIIIINNNLYGIIYTEDILAVPGASNSNLAGNVSVLLESAVTLSLQFKFPKPEERFIIIHD